MKSITSKNRLGRQTNVSWHGKFLNALQEEPNVRRACRCAKIGRNSAYDHKQKFPEFAEAWKAALEDSVDDAQGELYRRAVRGVDRTRFGSEGREITEKEYSDNLLMFFLKAHRPEVYGDKVSVTQTQKIAMITQDQLLSETNLGIENILKTIEASKINSQKPTS